MYWLTMWPPTFTQFNILRWKLVSCTLQKTAIGNFYFSYFVKGPCSAIMVSQDNETVTMLVTQTSRLFQYNSITLLATRVERSYTVYRIANICRAFGNAPGNALDITLLGRNSQLLFRKDREQFEFIRLQLLGGIWRRCIGVTLQV